MSAFTFTFTSTPVFPQLPPDKRKDPYRTRVGLARLILASIITPVCAHKIFSAAAAAAAHRKSLVKLRAISCWLAVDFVFRAVREVRFSRQAKGVLDLGKGSIGGRI